MVRRIKDEIAEYVVQLGTDGRLLSLQLEELTGGLSDDLGLVIRDYLPEAKAGYTHEEAVANLIAMDNTALLDPAAGARAMGFTVVGDALDSSVSPLGYRLLSKVPRLPGAIVDRLVDPLRQPPEAARRQHRRPHGRRRRRRGPGPPGPRGAVAARRVQHPRALRLTCRPPLHLAEVLHERVLAWFDAHGRDLPWRDPGTSAWGVFVSEVMSHQTPVARVEPVWRDWLRRWPAPADLAAEPPGEVVRAWGRLGYPRRALRLREAAVAMVERHGGEVPADEEALLALPGVGAYTAAAVAAFAYRRRTTVVDTNVRRVLARAVQGRALAAPALTAAEARLAASLVPEDAERAAAWNVAVMELGALVCRARGPRCAQCPLLDRCAWVVAGQPARRTGRRAGGRPGTAPTGRCGAGCSRRCATPTGRCPERRLEALADDAGQVDRCLASLVEDGLLEAGARRPLRPALVTGHPRCGKSRTSGRTSVPPPRI